MPCIEKSSGHDDHESGVCNQITVPMHDFKPFECKNYGLHIAEEKANIKANHGILCNFNDGKRDADLFLFEEKSVLESSCIKDSDECFKIPDLDSSEFKHPKPKDCISPLEDEKDASLQLNPHNAIKDINVDMGVPLVDKILIENLCNDKKENLGEDAQAGKTAKIEDVKFVDIKSVVSDCSISSSLDDNAKESAIGSKCHSTGKEADDGQTSEPNKNVQTSEFQDMPNSEEKTSAHLVKGDQDGFADGETSFSSVGPMSGLISYSGPVQLPGNVSIRSDSSTASTRSFAFPVLQPEWNSSPVRMSKAERRYRKQRGWRLGLLCCRF